MSGGWLRHRSESRSTGCHTTIVSAWSGLGTAGNQLEGQVRQASRAPSLPSTTLGPCNTRQH
eukprot:2618748-Alexandrium_andersonii.AAC.1